MSCFFFLYTYSRGLKQKGLILYSDKQKIPTFITIFYNTVTCTNKSTTWLYLFIKYNRLKMFWYNFFFFFIFFLTFLPYMYMDKHLQSHTFGLYLCCECDNEHVCKWRRRECKSSCANFIDVLLLSRRWLIIQDLCLVTRCSA